MRILAVRRKECASVCEYDSSDVGTSEAPQFNLSAYDVGIEESDGGGDLVLKQSMLRKSMIESGQFFLALLRPVIFRPRIGAWQQDAYPELLRRGTF
jgi:hypothetical protein